MHSDAPYPSWVLIWLVLPSGFADGELGTHPEQLRTQRHGMPVGRQGRQLWARDVKLSAQVKNAITCTFTALIGFCVTLKARALRIFLLSKCLRPHWTCVRVAREAMTPPWFYCSQATPTCVNQEISSSKCVDAHLVHTQCVCYYVIDYRL